MTRLLRLLGYVPAAEVAIMRAGLRAAHDEIARLHRGIDELRKAVGPPRDAATGRFTR